jgi:hypothetical protein
MEDLINALRRRREDARFELDAQDVFKLLALACSACCTETDGGNKTCPPKPATA